MNELLESEEAPLPQAALQQWLQKLDVGWNKLLEMWESRREVLVQAHIFHLFLRDVKQAESFLNNQVRSTKTQRESQCLFYGLLTLLTQYDMKMYFLLISNVTSCSSCLCVYSTSAHLCVCALTFNIVILFVFW